MESRWRAVPALVVAAVTVLMAGAPHRLAGWDESWYAAQTASLVHDGDLDLRNDLPFLDLAEKDLLRALRDVRPDGSLQNTFPLGVSLLWVPPFVAGSAIAGPPRWNATQRLLLGLWNAALAAALALLLWHIAFDLLADGRAAAMLSATAFLATPLLVYAFSHATMSHLASALFAAAVLLLAWRLETDRGLAVSLACGVALGGAALVRFQDAALAICLLGPLLAWRGSRVRWRDVARRLAWVGLSALPAFLLLVHAAWHDTGTWTFPPQGEGYLRIPAVSKVLFSPVAGALWWAPALWLGALGLLLPWRLRRPPRWRWILILVVVVETLVSASAADWWGGVSFGPRRLAVLVPLLLVGAANALAQPLGAVPRRLLPAIAVALAAWGLFTTGLFRHDVQDLALVLLGRPSDAPGLEREAGLVRDPEVARAAAFDFGPLLAIPSYFEPWGWSRSRSRALSILLVGLTVAAVYGLSCLRIRSRPPTLVAGLLVFGSLVMVCHLRLAMTPAPHGSEERQLWRRLARASVEGRLHARPRLLGAAPLPGTAPGTERAYRILQDAARGLEPGA